MSTSCYVLRTTVFLIFCVSRAKRGFAAEDLELGIQSMFLCKNLWVKMRNPKCLSLPEAKVSNMYKRQSLTPRSLESGEPRQIQRDTISTSFGNCCRRGRHRRRAFIPPEGSEGFLRDISAGFWWMI